MHRIDSATAEIDKFGAGKNGFTEGTPGVEAPTETTENWLDALQEEIISPIEGLGLTLVKAQNTQLKQALAAIASKAAVLNPTRAANPKNFALKGVTSIGGYVLGRWVAVGAADGVNGYVLLSDDNVNWAEVDGGTKNITLNAVGYGSNVLIAVGAADGADAYILRSADAGSTWTEIANAKNIGLNGVAYGNGKWVAVGNADGTNSYVLTSVDNGATWVENNNLPAHNLTLHGVAYGNGKWVAVGAQDGADAHLLTATDPTGTWTEIANPGWYLYGVGYGNGKWVAVGVALTGYSSVIHSTDGATWALGTIAMLSKDLYGVAYGNGVWVATGQSLTIASYVAVSTDNGLTWTNHSIGGNDVDLNAVAYGAYGQWMMVGGVLGAAAELLASQVVPLLF